ncbi:MAG: hypothetical protein M0C28_35820 [Candidatus Moduliflexus flocculans]|nr:hypothetical protein [Candidatus Moduliflexus flocculans]
MALTYKGKVEGETMAGEVQAGDFGAFPWTAKKKPVGLLPPAGPGLSRSRRERV